MKWISIKDRPPKDGQKVAVIYSPSNLFGCCEYQAPPINDDPRNGIWNDLIVPDDPYFHLQKISHWMPLPEFPNEMD